MTNTPVRSLHRQETTWYHIPVEIHVTENHIHRVRLPDVSLPHLGVVNWIVRRGLPLQTRLELTALHEFGHLQTLPVPLLHVLLMLWPRRRHSPYPSRWRLLVGLFSHQIIWEIAAECFVTAQDRRTYRTPRPRGDIALYALFWSSMALFSLLSTWFILKREDY